MNDGEIAKQSGVGALKAAIGAIPIIGSALNETFFEIRGRVKQERINSFVEELGAFMSELKDVQLDIHQITREDFSDFFEAVIRSVANNRSEKKKEVYKYLLVNQLENPVPIDYAELYNDIIGSLYEKQIPLLLAFSHSEVSTHIEFQRDLSNRIQHKNDIEREIKRPYKYHDDEGETNEESDLPILKYEISKLDKEIESNKDRIKTKYYPTPEEFGIENYEFYYLVQDLVNKGLLMDMSYLTGSEPCTLTNITEIGLDLIKVIRR
jgi:hypothetical protein